MHQESFSVVPPVANPRGAGHRADWLRENSSPLKGLPEGVKVCQKCLSANRRAHGCAPLQSALTRRETFLFLNIRE